MSSPWRMGQVAGATLAAILIAAPLGAQTAQTQQLMREKLTRSSALLGALVTSNWATLARESRELDAVTRKPGWEVLQFPEYARDTRAFNQAVQALIDASGSRDQAVALKAYTAVVSSCVECHRNVARRRIVTDPGR